MVARERRVDGPGDTAPVGRARGSFASFSPALSGYASSELPDMDAAALPAAARPIARETLPAQSQGWSSFGPGAVISLTVNKRLFESNSRVSTHGLLADSRSLFFGEAEEELIFFPDLLFIYQICYLISRMFYSVCCPAFTRKILEQSINQKRHYLL